MRRPVRSALRWRARRLPGWAVACAVVAGLATGCASRHPGARLPGDGAGQVASAPASASAVLADPSRPVPRASAPPCPHVSTARLEVPDPPPPAAPRTLPLTEIYAAKEPRPAGADVTDHDLRSVVLYPRRGDIVGGRGYGMGWELLQAEWVEDGIRPTLQAPFEDWLAASARRSHLLHRIYLLDLRHNYLRNLPERARGDDPVPAMTARCVERERERLDATRARNDQARATAADRLRARLEGLGDRTAAETLLFAALIDYSIEYDEPEAERDDKTRRALALADQVARDEGAPDELRARAHELMARRVGPQVPEFDEHLARALALTDDVELQVETLVKLADGDGGRRRRVERLERAIALASQLEPADRWRVAERAAELAALHLRAGRYEDAIHAAVRCANASPDTFARDPDPWGCADTLAEALTERARPVPRELEVPRPFLGPLALRLMVEAVARHDHDTARRVGALARAHVSDAPEAPAILELLARLEDDATAQRALRQEVRDMVADDSPWRERQRARMAWDHDPRAFRETLDRLAGPSVPSVLPPATDPADVARDLRHRAEEAAFVCEEHLHPRRTARVWVDTTGPLPSVNIQGASRALEACMTRAIAARFRSLGPMRITYRLRLDRTWR